MTKTIFQRKLKIIDDITTQWARKFKKVQAKKTREINK